MNNGKFRKRYLKYVDAQGINCDCMDCTAVTCRDFAALEIINELELALDTKNKAQEIRENGEIPDAKFLDAVKRYRDYGIE